MNQEVDSNNNAEETKYSLRPRTAFKRTLGVSDQDDSKECCLQQGKKTRKGSRPLSKYRRRSANARERSRMREINEAFETLRRVVSGTSAVNHRGEKMTKISTLRLAMKYITALSNALEAESEEQLTISRELQSHQLPTATLSETQSSLSFPAVSEHRSLQNITTPNDFKRVHSETLSSSRHQNFIDEHFASLITEQSTTGLFPKSITSEQSVDPLRTVNFKFESLYGSSRNSKDNQELTNTCDLNCPVLCVGDSNNVISSHERYNDIERISRIDNDSSQNHLQEMEDCSSRVSPDIQNLPFQAISLDELLIT